MTHDELKTTIENKFNNQSGLHDAQIVNALYRAVELHKPITDDWFNVGEIICEECTREEYTRKYPCFTIQAIEKELG